MVCTGVLENNIYSKKGSIWRKKDNSLAKKIIRKVQVVHSGLHHLFWVYFCESKGTLLFSVENRWWHCL